MQSRIDSRILVILGIFTLLFGGFGFYILLRQRDGWQIFSCICMILVPFWIGALSVRFEINDSAIHYRSIFRRLSLFIDTITAIEIVAESRKNAPQGVPRFYLRTTDRKREALNIRVLPIGIVQALCGTLQERGVVIKVADSFVARRMAKACFKIPLS